MTAFSLKTIALVAMVLSHLQQSMPDVFPMAFCVVGRLSFPLYAFLLGEGFRHTKSPQIFLGRLLMFAIISEPFYDWAFWERSHRWTFEYFSNSNVFFTLFLGGACICAYNVIRGKLTDNRWLWVSFLPVLLACDIAHRIGTDYSFTGVIMVFGMYFVGSVGTGIKKTLVQGILCFLPYLYIFVGASIDLNMVEIHHWFFLLFVMVAFVLIAFYNGKQGRSLKWGFYVAYPAHLAVLGIIAQIYCF